MNRAFLFGSLFVLAIAAGCAQDKLTRHNYDMIKEGTSTKDEVRLTLGDDYIDRSVMNQWEYEGKDQNLSVVFYFDDNGVVTRKEWIDAETGEWHGAAPHINKEQEGRPYSESNSSKTYKR